MSLIVPPHPSPRYTEDDYASFGLVKYHYLAHQEATAGTTPTRRGSLLMLFAPGAPREHYFEGIAQLGDMTEDERREWFVRNDNLFVDT
ncbi:hypothetical protein ABQE93_00915 [Mycolicibacterium sp. XJ662]